MGTIRREIQTFMLIGIITLIVISILLVRIRSTQSTYNIDLIELIPSSATAVMKINRPNDMRKFILSDQEINAALNTQIPTVFLKLMYSIYGNQYCLCSFHPQGIIFYAYVNNNQQIKHFKKKIFRPYFGDFAPQKQRIADTDIYFYVDKDNQFLGFYQKEGVFVASYSCKLLKETIRKSTIDSTYRIKKLAKEADTKVPFNLFINSDLLNIQINKTDSTNWKLKNYWLSADFFMNNNKLCYFGTLPYLEEMDSLYIPLTDTLTDRIKTSFPRFNFSKDIKIDGNKLLYSGRIEELSDR